MNKIILDGREVKVGDRLYCLCNGWGTIKAIDGSDGGDYPIKIKDDSMGLFSYTISGQYLISGKRMLYWDKPVFDIPKPPVRKVKKYRLLLKFDDDDFMISYNHYKTIEDFEDRTGEWVAIRIIPETEIEVEE